VRIGIDLGGTKIEAIALDYDGRTLLRRRVPTPAEGYGAILDAVADLVDLIEKIALHRQRGRGLPRGDLASDRPH
jgi:fructokinase